MNPKKVYFTNNGKSYHFETIGEAARKMRRSKRTILKAAKNNEKLGKFVVRIETPTEDYSFPLGDTNGLKIIEKILGKNTRHHKYKCLVSCCGEEKIYSHRWLLQRKNNTRCKECCAKENTRNPEKIRHPVRTEPYKGIKGWGLFL